MRNGDTYESSVVDDTAAESSSLTQDQRAWGWNRSESEDHDDVESEDAPLLGVEPYPGKILVRTS